MEYEAELQEMSAQSSVKYVDHIISDKGVHPDDEKIKAVKEMPDPQSKEDVRRFLSFIQYLAKFIPNLSEIDAPLREILKKTLPPSISSMLTC